MLRSNACVSQETTGTTAVLLQDSFKAAHVEVAPEEAEWRREVSIMISCAATAVGPCLPEHVCTRHH